MNVELSDPEFLTVRETARRLGVHENTIRNWARDGILRTARLPGSRFHRFDPRDVDRLKQQRGASVSSLERERRTVGPELVDATQLSQWAPTRDAQETFPELVRRLLASTPGITNVSVRAREGISAPGWDGRAESVGTSYLPSGSLCFEFGVGGQPKTKADEDYAKRRADASGVDPAMATFVFATPKRWAGANAWADERRAEGAFRDVRVLDADDLEGWLQSTPAVHHWLSEHLGRRPHEAQTLETWWARFQAQTAPPLPAGLFVAGRAAEYAQLQDFLAGPPSVVTVQAPWLEDALGFVCATIDMMTEAGNHSVQPPLIVSSREVWSRVILQPGRMTLMPLFEDPDIATAQTGGHHVLLAVGRQHVVRGPKIELPPAHRREAATALEAAGVDSESADDLAALARRSMRSLVRRISRDPRITRPPWSDLPASRTLAPLVLVGSWDDSDGDRDIVSRMAQEPWTAIERSLLHWLRTDDPPFVRSGTQWRVASADEAFLVLRDALTPTDLTRWAENATAVLLEADPQLELSAEERPMAGVMGVARAHTSVLRRGFAEGLALVASMGTDRLADGISGADHARRVVRGILGRANSDVSAHIWRSLADVLPLLAEAAPEVFLDAVHDDLDRAQPLLPTMFQDTDQSSWLYTSSPHTGLLWALETLCWSPQYLLEASSALARLQVVDPGGRLSNRPLQSLSTVLVGWIRHTAAPLELRVRAVEEICRRVPAVGWRLILALWPSQHGWSSAPASPHFRDWKPESHGVPMSDWIEYSAHLVRLAIDQAEVDPELWRELVERLGPLPPQQRSSLLDALEVAVQAGSFDAHGSLLLWERLHKEVAQHERFKTAEWAMDEGSLARLRTIADRLEPRGDVERFGYLFDWHPDLPDMDSLDHAAYQAKLLDLRVEALNQALEGEAIEGLRKLAERSPVPRHLGWTLGGVASEDLTPELLSWLDSADPKLCELAAAWAQRKLVDGGVPWLRAALARAEMATDTRRIALALSAPANRDVWNALADIDVTLSDAYWQRMYAGRVSLDDTARAVGELLRRGRSWVAIDLLADNVHEVESAGSALTPELVQTALEAALTSDSSSAPSRSLGYEIGTLLDYLEAQATDRDSLARYEFAFFRVLEHNRQPRALFTALCDQPAYFVDLVARVYRGKHEARRQLDEKEESLARHAWWVLHHWHGLPGQDDKGQVDGEHLKRWVREARLAFADLDRADIGDEQIGQVLACSGSGADGVWPAEPVRDVLETIGSQSIESGIYAGVIRARGVTTRGVYDGGMQEREIAERYQQWARQAAGTWPRTSRLLRGLAEDYERLAQMEDTRAQVTSDTE